MCILPFKIPAGTVENVLQHNENQALTAFGKLNVPDEI